MKKKPTTAVRSVLKTKSAEATTPKRSQKGPRTQEVRSADTKRRLVDAAIVCLSRYGYGATSVSLVAQKAKVSRGAMTHQFPSKTDLMVAVVQAVYVSDGNDYKRALEASPSKRQWMQDHPSTMWEVISKPSGIAVMEIMLASRSDRELANTLRSVQRDIDVHAHQWVIEQLESAGLKDRDDGDAIHRVFVAAVRGLALEGLFRRDQEGVEKCVGVLKEVMRLLYPAIVSPTKL